MSSVHDVASYILAQRGTLDTMKLQKLCYYSQAWHLAWENIPMFNEPIEAWANGPVVRSLFDAHKGMFTVDSAWSTGNSSNLNDAQKETINIVLEGYAHLTGRQLSILTHNESPWKDARGNLPDTARSNVEIAPESMQHYYSSVDTAREAQSVNDWASQVR